ncbi:sugar phosphate isomerase/epimerase family protein [Novosphingobium kaempferiae]|uniref:sugar phosphate isomerase/epimerase family protein n=1 Tax=Novosphingobium kaempferiae TaxID=2896849 RepID=UPI001E32D866|nr:TIM barrel protein [Novosphingobium kaempferiae]
MPVLDYAELAARLECDFISLNFGGAANRLDPHRPECLRDDPALRHRLTRKVRELGLEIRLVEGFAIAPGLSVDAYAADLEAAAEMGASVICAVSLDKDLARTFDQFRRLAEASAQYGLTVTTEVGAGVIRSLDLARAALAGVAHENFGLLLDTMHFFRCGATIEDLASIPAGALGHVQLCDVPMPAQGSSYLEEALFERCGLGEGDLPLRRLVDTLSEPVSLGLEIPIRSQHAHGLSAFERLGPSVRLARAWLADR